MLSTPTIVTFMSVNRSEEDPVDPGREGGYRGATYWEEGSLQTFQTQWTAKGKMQRSIFYPKFIRIWRTPQVGQLFLA